MKKSNIIVIFAACLLLVTSVHSQVTHGGNNSTGTDFVGFNSGVSAPLNIRNDFNDVINFKTNTNLQATLDALGNFSIGLNLNSNYYGIGSNTPVLWHNGKIKSIFVGVGAGNGTLTAQENTFVGYNTGNVITTGDSNVVVGTNAGASMTTAYRNTFIGFQAGNGTISSNVHLDFPSERPVDVAVGFPRCF